MLSMSNRIDYLSLGTGLRLGSKEMGMVADLIEAVKLFRQAVGLVAWPIWKRLLKWFIVEDSQSGVVDPKLPLDSLEDADGNTSDWQPKASKTPSDEYCGESESWDDVVCGNPERADHGYDHSGHEDEEFYVNGRD